MSKTVALFLYCLLYIDEGRQRCQSLAVALQDHQPDTVITSNEVKAQQTAEALATAFAIPIDYETLLHEHKRTDAPFLPDEQFLDTIHTFFNQPERLVFGNETAAQALQRFQRGINNVLKRYPEGNLIIVTHGTVLSLFVAHHTGQDPFTFWQQLDQPAFVIFNHPPFRLAATVFTV